MNNPHDSFPCRENSHGHTPQINKPSIEDINRRYGIFGTVPVMSATHVFPSVRGVLNLLSRNIVNGGVLIIGEFALRGHHSTKYQYADTTTAAKKNP